VKQLGMFRELGAPLSPLGMAHCAERKRVEQRFAHLMREEPGLGRLVSYAGNKNMPLLRLYRYKEAFAFELVEEFIRRLELSEADYLLDPFCGMGTTLLGALRHNIRSVGIDRLPIAQFVARTLPLFLTIEPQALRKTFEVLKGMRDGAEPAEIAMDVGIMRVAFQEDTLLALR